MAIGMAVQKGRAVFVYDERGWEIFNKLGELHGYTSTTVTIKDGGNLHLYDEKGWHLSSRLAQ